MLSHDIVGVKLFSALQYGPVSQTFLDLNVETTSFASESMFFRNQFELKKEKREARA